MVNLISSHLNFDNQQKHVNKNRITRKQKDE